MEDKGHLKQSLNISMRYTPASQTALLGRDQERQSINDLLVSSEVRLLTLTGTGGIGKTRLALALATDMEQKFTHGVYWIPLATLNDPQQVLPTIAQGLELRRESSLSLVECLKNYLCKKHLLLVLDNFEHLIAAAPQLVDLLIACPQLKMLITSREVLHVTSEYVYQVPPLDVPDLTQPLTCERIVNSAAIMLFVQRTQKIKPDFLLTDENADAVARICMYLEGLPLAIELAAARIRLMSPKQLLARLEQRLPILASMQQDISPRQQTMRNTIKWSYDFLSEEEQSLFCCLAVFVGGFTLYSIETVYTILGKDPGFVLDGITSLLDKSLILQQDQKDGEPRLFMLETLREFGLECLRNTSQLQRYQKAHAAYYHMLVEQVTPLDGYNHLTQFNKSVKQLEPEHANIHKALDFLMAQGEIMQVLQMINTLGTYCYWFSFRMFREGCHLVEQVIQSSRTYEAEQVLPLRAYALFYLAYLAFWQNDVIRSRALIEECLELAQKSGDKNIYVRVLRVMGMLESSYPGGNSKKCDELYQKSLSIFKEIDDKLGLADAFLMHGIQEHYRGESTHAFELFKKSLQLASPSGCRLFTIGASSFFLGWSLFQLGDVVEARHRIEECLVFFRKADAIPFHDDALVVLGLIAISEGNEAQAQSLFEEALHLGHTLGKKECLGKALYGLGYLAQRRGDLAQSRALYEEALVTIEDIQCSNRILWIIASCLEGIGSIALTQGMAPWTVCLFAAADAQRRMLAFYTPIGIEHPNYEQALTTARAQLGEKRFALLWAEGQQMTPKQAFTSQTQEPMSGIASSGAKSSSLQIATMSCPPIDTNDLTKREFEVLCWVAQGKTNAQIAEELILSTTTINSYLRSIYSKLGVSSRTQAIRYALDHNLLQGFTLHHVRTASKSQDK